MSCETETAVTLRDAGQKITPQRMLILSTLRHAGVHVTAPAVLEEVRRSYRADLVLYDPDSIRLPIRRTWTSTG